MLVVDQLCKSYGATRILDRFCLHLEAGGVWALCGPSGSGKSTLLKCIAGLEQYEGGRIEVQGSVGIVLQSYALFPHLDGMSNITMPLVLNTGMDKQQAQQQAMQLLEQVDMQAYAKSDVSCLSGGEQQRIAIARALALQPDLLLLDEPSAALDPENTARLAKLLKKLAAVGTTIVVATHDYPFVQQLDARQLQMEAKRL